MTLSPEDREMPPRRTVLLVGGTGRTGRRVLQQLLDRGVNVRVVVRSARGLPDEVRDEPGLAVLEAELLSLGEADLLRQLRGCDAVISCLGHVISFRGVFGPPRDLVTRATKRLCRGIEALRPAQPVRFILMSSVSVHRPGGLDIRRGRFERAIVWLIRRLLPPARDNQAAADFLHDEVGRNHPFVQWAVVRPDTLLAGEVTGYSLHEGLVSSLFAPGHTNMANVAHFMCELTVNPGAWDAWQGELPVIVNGAAPER